MKSMKIAVFGYGNIGRAAEQAVKKAKDMELVGVFHHDEMVTLLAEKPDVVLLCTPTREVPVCAPLFLKAGICTVDSFDIHNDICKLRAQLSPVAEQYKAVSVISAGWDPGSDSVIRVMMHALVPEGQLFTNFGPGRSMGHSVAAKAIPGVKDALSMTLPAGEGRHNRHVYIELEEGYEFEKVKEAILHDDYFAHDYTEVERVDSVAKLDTHQHGVHIERNGMSGITPNQQVDFTMRINNPALTGQMMVSCARAAVRMHDRQQFGSFTTVELAPIDLLPGEREDLIAHLV
ncbi:MAG: diaminopimelate dehydrogenase [Paludibacteraceae bacterium]|nr:diaminopimelate dehydrogenase [Paludibacteraceae bacterium]